MAAANDQLVPVELDFVYQQTLVRFAQARGRVVELFLERCAEHFDGISIYAAHRERLAVLELRHLGQNLAATRLELLRTRTQRLVDRERTFLNGLIKTIQTGRSTFKFFPQRDEPRIQYDNSSATTRAGGEDDAVAGICPQKLRASV